MRRSIKAGSLLVFVVIAASVMASSPAPSHSPCDIVGTWKTTAYRINGGDMTLAGEELLIINETHWARVGSLHNMGYAGQYEVVGDSVVWQYEIGGDKQVTESCRTDSEGLHTSARMVSEEHGTDTLVETDFQPVE
jgi:hypothetical protein